MKWVLRQYERNSQCQTSIIICITWGHIVLDQKRLQDSWLNKHVLSKLNEFWLNYHSNKLNTRTFSFEKWTNKLKNPPKTSIHILSLQNHLPNRKSLGDIVPKENEGLLNASDTGQDWKFKVLILNFCFKYYSKQILNRYN